MIVTLVESSSLNNGRGSFERNTDKYKCEVSINNWRVTKLITPDKILK